MKKPQRVSPAPATNEHSRVEISHSTISLGAFTPTPDSVRAAEALAQALRAQAEAVCAVAAMLTPPAMPNATGVKIGQ